MDGPMTLSREAIDSFKRIYQSEFGEALSDDAAREMALRLLRVFDLLSRPVPDDQDEESRAIDS
jgi:hypothetical protein